MKVTLPGGIVVSDATASDVLALSAAMRSGQPTTLFSDAELKQPSVKHHSVRTVPATEMEARIVNAMREFPEGISSTDIAALIDVPVYTVIDRITLHSRLRTRGIVERVPKHKLWRLTDLGRTVELATAVR